jgi:hypothetical protein
MSNPTYRYQVTVRSAAVGGGWKLQLLEDDVEVGGGVFPPGDDGYCDAIEEGNDWLYTRPHRPDPFQEAIQHAIDGALSEEPTRDHLRVYVFLGRLIGALEPLDPVLAAKIQSIAPGLPAAPADAGH